MVNADKNTAREGHLRNLHGTDLSSNGPAGACIPARLTRTDCSSLLGADSLSFRNDESWPTPTIAMRRWINSSRSVFRTLGTSLTSAQAPSDHWVHKQVSSSSSWIEGMLTSVGVGAQRLGWTVEPRIWPLRRARLARDLWLHGSQDRRGVQRRRLGQGTLSVSRSLIDCCNHTGEHCAAC